MQYKHFRKITSLFLAVLMTLSLIPSTLAAGSADAGTVTDMYVNEADGREIAAPQTVKSSEVKNPQTIMGYIYKSFSEVTEHVYAKEDLTYLKGYPDKTVRGERYLSRAEAATIFYRLYDGYYPKLQRQMTSRTFSDIPRDAWYYSEVEMCYNAGLIDGYAGGVFRPNDPITRAEFAIIAARFAELPNSDKQMFNDVTKNHWAFLLINAAAEAGWIKGYSDGTYRPESTISRSETVTLINRMRNRSITVAELKALGVVNPYIDLVETYWAYSDLLEATIKHAATDWHDLTFNDGNINVAIEKYVDVDGNEIAGQTVSQGRVNYAPRQFARHYYLGYVTTITYVYGIGAAQMTATKSVDKSTARVGDVLTYAITAGNAEAATAILENVTMTDAIPDYLDFTYGSVQVDGVSAPYSYDNATKKLSIALGDIAPGQTRTITFSAVISAAAYGKKFTNTAILTADNDDEKTVKDGGVIVEDGKARMSATKSANKSTARVGDALTYTITVGNAKTATANLEKVTMTDVIPAYLSFTYGSVQVDGVSTPYSYDSTTMKLTVALGDIAPGQTRTITFSAVINAAAYGKKITNTAVLTADNDGDKPATDGGVTVEDGTARMSATKSANKATAKVGDALTYTVTAGNAEAAAVNLKNVTMSDIIPEYLNFSHGSVQVDGVTAPYSYDSATMKLSVALGDIAPGQSRTITFSAVINASAYGKKFNNVAVLSADNDGDKPAMDGGVTVEDGVARMSATKTADKSTAKVGDVLIYTITTANAETATANLKNVTMNDVIPEYLSFSYGSVQVDGYSAWYSYDNESRLLSVDLGDIAPGQTKVITFTAVINSTAYGKKFVNTAVLSADNDDNRNAKDNGVTVADGTAEGSVGAKTVSSPTAKVGDTLTYAITLRNASTATAAWKNVKVADVIPEYLSFVSGSVEEDGRASVNASYNAGTKTLTLFADSIAPGQTKTFTFKATVKDGAQGKYIVNTAIVSSDGRDDIQLPDTGVQVDAGKTIPYVSKTASVSEARAGDIFTYTVTMKNGADATATWKNIILSDVLPAGVKLVAGSVTLNGITVSYGIAGQAIEVTAGDLKPGADAVVAFDVRVLDSAAGTTFYNVAAAKGDNGEKTATDNGVTVPAPEDETPDGGTNPKNTVTGSKTVDKTIVITGEKVKYTITAVNNTKDTWTGVQVYDVLDTSVLTLIDDSIFINSVRYLSGSGKWTFTDRQLVVNLGDIAAGQSVKCDFSVQFKNDAANSSYTNHATIRSTNKDSVYVKAPEVTVVNGGNNPFTTDIHYRLFSGFGDGYGNPRHQWRPVNDMQLNHMCLMAYRLMTDYYRNSLGNGTFTVPDTVTDRECRYFISHGIISAAEYTEGAATQAQIYRILNYAIGANLYSNSTASMSRASVASLVCDLTGRDKSPNTNGLTVAYFMDKGSYSNLIDEVSNSHDYTMDSRGKETWFSILID